MVYTAHLKNRAVLGISGPNAVDFLQGACTQDIRNLTPGEARYGAHLSPQGRFLFDFFIFSGASEGEIFLECAAHELMGLARSLHRFAVGRRVEFNDYSLDYAVYALWGGAEKITNAFTRFADPRLPALGERLLLPTGKVPKTKATLAEEADYEAHRLTLGVPDGSVDGLKNRTLTAELGLEHLNGVSFTKGCYVGQELTARLHYRTQAKKRLYVARGKAGASLPPPTGAETFILREGKEAGWLFSRTAETGLAIVRERYKEGPLTAEGVALELTPPAWWRS